MQINLLFEGAVKEQFKQQASTNTDVLMKQPLGGKKKLK